MIAGILLGLIVVVCLGITVKQAIKPVPHTEGDECPPPLDPDGKGRHFDRYF